MWRQKRFKYNTFLSSYINRMENFGCYYYNLFSSASKEIGIQLNY